eukprot:1188698-Prymnesium_polylepis.1
MFGPRGRRGDRRSDGEKGGSSELMRTAWLLALVASSSGFVLHPVASVRTPFARGFHVVSPTLMMMAEPPDKAPEEPPALRPPPKASSDMLTDSERRRLEPVNDLKRRAQYTRPPPEDERGWGDRRPTTSGDKE